jgi:hypothetical protein
MIEKRNIILSPKFLLVLLGFSRTSQPVLGDFKIDLNILTTIRLFVLLASVQK